MQIVRVGCVNGDATYEVRDMTESEAEIVAALADFPFWTEQPREVADVCGALRDGVRDIVPSPWRCSAEAQGMTDSTTVVDED